MLSKGDGVVVVLRSGRLLPACVDNPDCWGPGFSIDTPITLATLSDDPFVWDYADEGITWTRDTSPAGVEALLAAILLRQSAA